MTLKQLSAFGALTVLSVTSACAGSDDDPAATDAPAATEAAPETEAPVETTPPPATDAPEPAVTEAPTATDAPAATEAPPATEAEPEVRNYDFSALSPLVQDFVDDNGLNGAGLIIVRDDDGVIHEEYWNDFNADRISLIASSSKMITAGVLLALQDDGLLDIDAPVADVIDWGADHPDITPAQLVSNSSGLLGLTAGLSVVPYLCQYVADGTLQECAAQIFETPDDDDLVIAPDTEFRYGGAQWQIAGAVAEAASGQSWDELIDEIYVEPCGLETLAFNNHFTQIGEGGFVYPDEFNSDPTTLIETDNPNLEGGAYVTTGDYAKLLLMHLRGGTCGDNQVLSQEALDTMHADRVAEVYGGDAGGAGTGYGMGWWIDRESGRRSDGGAYGSMPWLDLEDGYGAYLVVEDSAGTGGQLAALLYEPIDAAIAAAT